MSKLFYVTRNNQKKGPFTIEQITGSTLLPNDLMWCEGMTEWELAKDVEEFKSRFPPDIAAPPPLPKKQSNVTNELNVIHSSYKCDWCNTEYNQQFMVCKECKKKRKDIWWDERRGYSGLFGGLLLIIVAALIIFYFPGSPLEEGYEIKKTTAVYLSIFTLIGGFLIMIYGTYFSYRAQRKMKISDFD
jgi:hypothetical protein